MRRNRIINAGATFAAVGAVTLGFAAMARADNLLQNPGFESPTTDPPGDNHDLDAWTLQFDTERASFQVHSGTFSLWMKTFQPAGGGVTQNVAVVPGSSYILSSFLYFEDAYNTSTAQIQLQLTFEDVNGNQVGNITEVDVNPTDNPKPDVYTLYSAPAAVAPAGAAQAMVFIGWNGGGTVPGAQSVFADDTDLEGFGGAINFANWGVDAAGDYNVKTNWNNRVVPNGIDATANFLGAITSNHTVFTDVPITLGTINFDNANSKYVLTGAGSLTLQASTGTAQVNVMHGTQEINLPTTLNSNTVFNVAAGATLIVADPITIIAGKTLTSNGGSGTVIFESTITTSGSVNFASTTFAHALNINSSGNSTINGAGTLLTLDTLTNSGVLDVNNGALDIGSIQPIKVYQQLAQGYNAGKWNGTAGIKSTAAANDATKRTALGFATAGDVGLTTLDGQTLDPNSVVVKYTYYGDASLDGKVDLGNDFALFLAGYLGNHNGWYFGDFNYDGVVNNTDFDIFIDGFKSQGGSLGDLENVIEAAPSLSAAQKASLLSVVPEPAAAGLLVMATATALRAAPAIVLICAFAG